MLDHSYGLGAIEQLGCGKLMGHTRVMRNDSGSRALRLSLPSGR